MNCKIWKSSKYFLLFCIKFISRLNNVLFKHSCDICQQTLSSERELKRHKERVHEKKKEWLCSHCGFSAFSRSSLKLHVRTHTGISLFNRKWEAYLTLLGLEKGQICLWEISAHEWRFGKNNFNGKMSQGNLPLLFKKW